MTAATLTAWLKNPGDPVTAGEPIAEVETDKTTVELEAPADGMLEDIRVAAGTEAVAVGTVLALVREGAPGETGTRDAAAEASAPAGGRGPGAGAGGGRRRWRRGRTRTVDHRRYGRGDAGTRVRGRARNAAGAADGRAHRARPRDRDRFRGTAAA